MCANAIPLRRSSLRYRPSAPPDARAYGLPLRYGAAQRNRCGGSAPRPSLHEPCQQGLSRLLLPPARQMFGSHCSASGNNWGGFALAALPWASSLPLAPAHSAPGLEGGGKGALSSPNTASLRLHDTGTKVVTCFVTITRSGPGSQHRRTCCGCHRPHAGDSIRHPAPARAGASLTMSPLSPLCPHSEKRGLMSPLSPFCPFCWPAHNERPVHVHHAARRHPSSSGRQGRGWRFSSSYWPASDTRDWKCGDSL